MAEIATWAALVLAVLYSYAGYPALLWLLARLRPRPVRQGASEPTVSLIIAAYNEERCIRARLENALALDYPRDKLEIIVASDASTDATDRIVGEFANRGVRLVRSPGRFGKVYAQNLTVSQSAGDVLVFSDANSMYEPDAVKKLVRNLVDPNVAYVSGELRYHPARSAIGRGEALYWLYETWIKRWESATGNLINGNGGIYAIPRAHYIPVDEEAGADMWFPLAMIRKGHRTVHERGAVAYEETSITARDEYGRKHRSIARAVALVIQNVGLMNPFRYGLTALKLFSHRALRYLVPFLVILIAALNLALLRSPFFQVTAALQAVFYLGALAGAVMQSLGKRAPIFYVPYYFCVANMAALKGIVRYARGEDIRTWEKAETTRLSSQRIGNEQQR